MENASKALIIAGAILLSILIIGLGMMVFKNAKNALTSANLDQEQIDAFNSKYESYIGGNKRGTDVRTLCSTVSSSNATAEDENKITIVYSGKKYVTQSELIELRDLIKNGLRYTVEAEYNDDTHFINKITITGGTQQQTPVTPTE